jgi:hypothetical protein
MGKIESVLNPYGIAQSLPYEPPDWDELRRKLDEMTDEERLEATLRYIRERYSNVSYRWQG